MPHQTFFNLDTAKREKIINAAIDEFAENTLETASVAAIVSKAGIPRGSFYQYFDGLEDIYEFIIEYIGEKKLEYLAPTMKKVDANDPFDVLRETYKTAVKFTRDQPKYAAITNQVSKESENTKSAIIKRQKEKGRAALEQMLKKGQEKGFIDKSIDIKVATFIITASNAALIDYTLGQLDEKDLDSKFDYILEQVNQVLYILENGLRR